MSKNAEKPTGQEVRNPTKKPLFYSVQLGIWKVFILLESKSKSSFFQYLPTYAETVSEALQFQWLIIRLLSDFYSLAPLQLIIYILNEFGQSLQGSAILYLNSQILEEVRPHWFDPAVLTLMVAYI